MPHLELVALVVRDYDAAIRSSLTFGLTPTPIDTALAAIPKQKAQNS